MRTKLNYTQRQRLREKREHDAEIREALEDGEDVPECQICYQQLTSKNKVELSCEHNFYCVECIDTWFKNHDCAVVFHCYLLLKILNLPSKVSGNSLYTSKIAPHFHVLPVDANTLFCTKTKEILSFNPNKLLLRCILVICLIEIQYSQLLIYKNFTV